MSQGTMKNFKFFYLLSTTDKKEGINQFHGNVNVNPVDCSLEFLSCFSNDGVRFQPGLLNSEVPEIHNPQVKIMYDFFNHMAKTSNQNIMHNSDHLIATNNIDNLICLGLVQQSKDLFQQSLN